ncbi:DUF397 domain-containing protein [Actinomadura oligospora]|uniref:DUF397 domain-containing protein n=1 Tax=Actinomadura oligospora TaxID=111804 RepID=UPI00047D0CB9|nr:DUF397 domain-containing protein [Actinomadura oligospora]
MGLDDPRWRKSSHSADNGGDCVELADLASAVGVRDSKDPDGPRLTTTREELAALTQIIKVT